jgi:hypothetical protein
LDSFGNLLFTISNPTNSVSSLNSVTRSPAQLPDFPLPPPPILPAILDPHRYRWQCSIHRTKSRSPSTSVTLCHFNFVSGAGGCSGRASPTKSFQIPQNSCKLLYDTMRSFGLDLPQYDTKRAALFDMARVLTLKIVSPFLHICLSFIPLVFANFLTS